MSSNYPDVQKDEDIEQTVEMFEDVNDQQDKQEVLRRIRQAQYNQVFGTERGKGGTLREWDKHDYQNRVLAALEDIATSSNWLMKHGKAALKRGIVYGSWFTLTAAAHYTHIDFSYYSNKRDFPATGFLKLPGQPARKLTIFNEGIGRIRFATNVDEDSTEMNGRIPPGQSYILDTGEPKIQNMNIGAEGADADVDIIVEI